MNLLKFLLWIQLHKLTCTIPVAIQTRASTDSMVRKIGSHRAAHPYNSTMIINNCIIKQNNSAHAM